MRADLPRTTEKQYQQPELQASNSWHTLDFYSAVVALRSCIFVYGLLSLLFIKVSFGFFEISFNFLFIHIVTRIFTLPCHGVPCIVNMDRNFV